MTDLLIAHARELVVVWSGVGVVLGAVLVHPTRRLIATPEIAESPVLWLTGPVFTGLAFGVVAALTGPSFALLPFSYLATVGVVLSVVDVVEHRLPGRVVLPSYVVVGSMLAAHAAVTENWEHTFRAAATGATLIVCYLALAFASRGGLGSGDVKLAGLTGMASGWVGWPAVLWATFLAWALAGASLIMLSFIRTGRPAGIAMGPFLLVGALCTAGLPTP